MCTGWSEGVNNVLYSRQNIVGSEEKIIRNSIYGCRLCVWYKGVSYNDILDLHEHCKMCIILMPLGTRHHGKCVDSAAGYSRSEEGGLPWGAPSPQAPGSMFAAEDGCVQEGCQGVCMNLT